MKRPFTKLKSHIKDYNGNDIYEGDKIIHPSGQTATVKYLDNDIDNWRVDYGDGVLSRLSLQVGDKGMATVFQCNFI